MTSQIMSGDGAVKCSGDFKIDDLNMTKRFQMGHIVDICSLRLCVQTNNIPDTGQMPFIRTPRNQY